MQLNKGGRISSALSAATCILLGSASTQAVQKNEKPWEVDAAILIYDEENRVQAIEPKIQAKKSFAGDKKLKINLVLDSLTGASPNGAAPSDEPQTFTRPSGEGDFVVPAGSIPLDDTFKDTRAQIGLNWDASINRLTRYNLGGNVSREYDYTSLMLSGGLSRDFNKRNTTLSVGTAYAKDSFAPEGGIPIPKAAMMPVGSPQARGTSNESKNTTDLALGLTQVINARTLMQFNVGLSRAKGYLNDPFKVVSIVDSEGRPTEHIYELRPNSRLKNYLYWNTKHHFTSGSTVDVSYRFMNDDWGIDSHTVDLRYRLNVTNQLFLEPHVRFYQQTSADFYYQSLAGDDKFKPDYLSADYRLAKFTATTLGVKVSYKLSADQSITMRLENYTQAGKQGSNELIGIQNNYATFPDLSAVIFQIGYSFTY